MQIANTITRVKKQGKDLVNITDPKVVSHEPFPAHIKGDDEMGKLTRAAIWVGNENRRVISLATRIRKEGEEFELMQKTIVE